MIKYILLGLTVPIIVFFALYRWERLKNKTRNLTLTTSAAILMVGILLIIALLID